MTAPLAFCHGSRIAASARDPLLTPEPQSAVARLSDRELENLIAAVRRKIEFAREDPVDFFEAVARDERHRPVIAAPHQVLAYRFVELYPASVLRLPSGASKTYLMMFYALWKLGRESSTARGAIVSAAQSQSRQPVDTMRRYIEESEQLALIFPNLRRTPDPNLPWRADSFVVDRPAGLRDPSMVALGMDANIPGRRWSWALIDDVLTGDNTRTEESRQRLYTDFDSQIISRLDTVGYQLVVTNTPWDRHDLTYALEEKAGYPTLSMGIDGRIRFGGVLGGEILDLFGDLVRPSRRGGYYRLLAHDPDPAETVPLWSNRFSAEWIAERRRQMVPHSWARVYLCEPMDSASARCQREWVEAALAKGKGLRLPLRATDGSRRFTGVDIGGVKRGQDLSSIVTIEELPRGIRRLLNIQSGHWTGPDLVERLIEECRRYDSTAFVESNAAQQHFQAFTRARDASVRVVNFNTTASAKDHLVWGVESVFAELMQGAWIWPSDVAAQPHPEVQELGSECVFYSAAQHPGDRLMALFLARQGIARAGVGTAARVGKSRSALSEGGGF